MCIMMVHICNFAQCTKSESFRTDVRCTWQYTIFSWSIMMVDCLFASCTLMKWLHSRNWKVRCIFHDFQMSRSSIFILFALSNLWIVLYKIIQVRINYTIWIKRIMVYHYQQETLTSNFLTLYYGGIIIPFVYYTVKPHPEAHMDMIHF